MPGQQRGRRQIEALARLRVATPPAGEISTHDSIRANRKFSRRRGSGDDYTKSQVEMDKRYEINRFRGVTPSLLNQ